MINQSHKIKNYKCFATTEQGFEKIYPLNIIIGKNNSGKSSLIDLIEFAISPNDAFLQSGRDNQPITVIIEDIIKKHHVANIFPATHQGGGIPGNSHFHYGESLIGQKFKYSLGSKKNILYWERPPVKEADGYVEKMKARFNSQLTGRTFYRINAERDINPETSNPTSFEVKSNGQGATNLIRNINNNATQNLNLIRKDLLTALNDITMPEAEYVNIVPRELGNIWEIYLEDRTGLLIPLSQMGSGIKTILLTLINMLILPEIKKIKKSDVVYGFEELENNLHPSLQRRLFDYIIRSAEQNNSYFFITTHSSVVIDLFSSKSHSQIIHIQNNGSLSTTKSVSNLSEGKNILRDLDFRASDILMSNGILWVEGPSDAIYIELFLKLLAQDKGYSNKGYFNYSIQALATSVWKYSGFNEIDWLNITKEAENKIISLERVNYNHILILDKDNNYEDKKPSEWKVFVNGNGRNKAKLVYESIISKGVDEANLINNDGEANDSLYFWITEGTIESYLQFFIENKGKERFEKFFDLNKDRGFFEKRRTGDNFSKSKVELAFEISKYCLDEDIKLQDIAPEGSSLRRKIIKLDTTIKQWS